MAAQSTALSSIDSATFFSQNYPTVSAELAACAGSVTRLVRDPDNEGDRASLTTSAHKLLREAFAVCSVASPSPDDDGARSFVRGVLLLIAVLSRLDNPKARECAGELQRHADYICEKVDVGDDKGALHPGEFAYFRDFAVAVVTLLCNNLFSRYKWKGADPRKVSHFFDADTARAQMSSRSRTLIEESAARLEGWCSSDKAAMLFDLVRSCKPLHAVEIGIYGGRSIVPIALALQENKAGVVIGIETWTAAGSTRFRTSIADDFHWSIVNYGIIKRNFFQFALEHDLLDVIKVIEASSDRASALIDAIDFIHIDGGHSAFGAAQDIVTYVSKVRTGGIVVFDDIDWETTGPAVEILRDSCQLLHVVPSLGQPHIPGCAAFRKL